MVSKRIEASRPTKPKAVSKFYTFEVFLIGGPVTEAFAKANPVVSRSIQIRGDQTLDDLHWAIFGALDRDDAHMYEFQFGKKPMDRKAVRYVMPQVVNDPWLDTDKAQPTTTPLDQLGLKPRQAFFYWFDFGDDWWHQIKVKTIEEIVPKGKYPKVLEKVGASPPQYPALDEEDE